MSYVLKQADERDIPHFITLGQHMHHESVYQFLPFDKDIAEQTAQRYVTDERSCAYLIMDNDQPLAMHLASLTTYFFSPALLAAGLVTYVRPEKRGSRAALLLMRGFITWAKHHQADEVYMGVSAGISIERADQFFKHFGFTFVGGNYKLRL